MPVYVTAPKPCKRSGRWPFGTHSYMVADSQLELDDMAAAIRLDCRHKQKPFDPAEHYDLTASYFYRAKEQGARVVGLRDVARLIQRKRAEGIK